jgi:hypothetical protein
MGLRLALRLVAPLAALFVIAATPRVARACGGCFVPPNPMGTPTAVDAHRMVITVAPGRTILWDQIVYTGNPGDFVWVLPVAPGTVVELADNTFFEALTQTTQITMSAPAPPRLFCPDPCGTGRFFFGGGASPSRSDAGAGGVIVEHQGVVGPYETATIMSDDPGALVAWMNEHGYLVDDAMLPTIAHYASMGLSFAILRLEASASVDRMQPVRVAMSGTSPTLPLRMVAAGAGVDLNLELFVLAESRMEVSTYGNAEVDRAAITYDWSTATFDYDARFEDALFAGEGSGANWVTEYAMPLATLSVLQRTTYEGGMMHSSDADVMAARSAFPAGAEVHLTRLRTRLRPNDLRDDLVLRLSTGGEIGNRILVTRELNRVPEPVCPVCESSDGLSPGGESGRGRGSTYRCSARGGRGASGPWLLAGVALILVVRTRARSRQAGIPSADQPRQARRMCPTAPGRRSS